MLRDGFELRGRHNALGLDMKIGQLQNSTEEPLREQHRLNYRGSNLGLDIQSSTQAALRVL